MRKKVSVNELLLQDMIAGNNSQTIPSKDDTRNDEISLMDGPVETKENIRTPRKRKEQPGYEELYLTFKPASKLNRQQIYVSGELYEKFGRFLKVVVNDRRVSMTSYINNILHQHWEDNKEVINALYEKYKNQPLETSQDGNIYK